MKQRWIILSVILVNFVFSAPKDSTHKDPKTAFWFSLIPGMGQLYNGKFIKSAMVLGFEIAAYTSWVENKNIYNNYDQGNYSGRKYRYLEKRNKYAWWIGFIYVYGMIDAIVDTHLDKFDLLMDSPLDSNQKGNENDAE